MSKSAHTLSWGHLLGLVALGLICLSGIGYSLLAQTAERDAQGCVVGKPLAASIALVVDATDPLTQVHRARLARAVDDMLRDAPVDAKLIVLTIQPEEAPQEAFARCNPGATGNELTENVARVRALYQGTFAGPLRAAVDTLSGASGASRSPIIEALTALTQRPDFDRRVPSRTLIVASDMLQNSSSYSQYRGDMARTFRHSALARGDQADFAGIEVSVDYFVRPDQRHRQGPAHRAFWDTWFKERGARAVRFLGVAMGGRTS